MDDEDEEMRGWRSTMMNAELDAEDENVPLLK